MMTLLQENLPLSFLNRGIEGLMPVLDRAGAKPLSEMLVGFVERLQRGEEVNVHEYCCGAGVATEQIQLLLNALCIAADVRARASVIGSDINPLHEKFLYSNLAEYHDIAFIYLNNWDLSGVDVEVLRKEPQLQKPQACFVSSSVEQPIAHPGPLDLSFCINGIWYLNDKLGHIFDVVESLRMDLGLAVWDVLSLDSVLIRHVKNGAWQGPYRLRNFLKDHGGQDFQFDPEREDPIYTLSARRVNESMGSRPRFLEAVNANAPASRIRSVLFNFDEFRRLAKYEFEEE